LPRFSAESVEVLKHHVAVKPRTASGARHVNSPLKQVRDPELQSRHRIPRPALDGCQLEPRPKPAFMAA